MFVEIAFSADKWVQQLYSQLRIEHKIFTHVYTVKRWKFSYFVSPIFDNSQGMKIKLWALDL